uniref:ND3 n=1 Tax=Polytomella sp. Pringsheim 198.80 TaxID=37502 RepID=UPI001E1E2425|nr:Chain A, ND3 [Polytomella sp. Pringsheim 198.80]7ARD_A Chain A, ND3 [Polytomella sp. Pringsheim 198.80]
MQKRTLYNAMTPAQRYFVEGEHVVQAEANRDILFTQLDSNSYLPVLHYVLVGTALGVVFLVLPLLIAPARVDLDKISAYECGFDAFGEARETFSVSFYIVSIMYLLFDIEVVYLIPYVMTNATEYMYWVMQTFVAILVGGFFYEWRMGALEWRE